MTAADPYGIPIIVEVALNGATSVESNPNVPRTSSEITADALRCIEAGAALIHTHIADISVEPTRAAELYLEHYRPILEARPDVIFYPTIVAGVPVEERVAHFPILSEKCGLRMGICDPGSVNLVATDDDGLPTPIDFVYANSPYDVRYMFELCEKHRLGPGISIFEPGFLRYVLAYERACRLPAGANVRLYLGGEGSYRGEGHVDLLFGLPAKPASIDTYVDMLEGSAVTWSVAVQSGDVLDNDVARHALLRGGHVRVGLEDYAGPKTPTNEELVRAVVSLVREVGRPLATPDEAAKIIGLPR